ILNLGIEHGFPYSLISFDGFSGPEVTHRWTDSKDAFIKFPLYHNQMRLNQVSFIDTYGYVTSKHSQRAETFLNGNQEKQYNYNTQDPCQTIKIEIPQSNTEETSKEVTISFNFPDAQSPTDIISGREIDSRKLGIAVNQVKLSYGLEIKK